MHLDIDGYRDGSRVGVFHVPLVPAGVFAKHVISGRDSQYSRYLSSQSIRWTPKHNQWDKDIVIIFIPWLYSNRIFQCYILTEPSGTDEVQTGYV